VWLGVALAITLVANQRFQFITDVRYLMALWPPLAVAAGIGWGRWKNGRWITAGLWALAGLWITLAPLPRAPGEWKIYLPWQTIQREMQTYSQPGDTFIFWMPPPVVNWFHARIAEYYLSDLGIDYHVVDSPDPRVKNDEAYRKEAEDFVGNAARVWIGREINDLPYPIVEREFQRVFDERGFALCGTFDDSAEVNLRLYVRGSADGVTGNFGDGISLRLLQPIPEQPLNKLDVMLGWTVGADVPQNTYSVGIHILNSNGELVRQADYGLPASDAACTPTKIPLDGLTAGNYRVMAMVYNWQTNERLSIEGDQVDENRMLLGIFSVGNS
jgi:hypothetical protein